MKSICHRISLVLFLIVLAFFTLARSQLCAQEWKTDPSSGDWNTASNWTPAIVPNSTTAIAIFDISLFTSLSISSSVEVGSILFDSGAIDTYTITVQPSKTLDFNGAGVTNLSGITQKLATGNGPAATFGEIDFRNGATAGSSTTIANGGVTKFYDSSGAGSATLENHGPAFSGGGGTIEFHDTSTAGSATINNAGGAQLSSGGTIAFHENSSAGTATINNAGSSNGASVGTIEFHDTSTAGSATINNADGTPGGIGGGDTKFLDNSTLGTATINNLGGTQPGGTTEFHNSASAGSGTVVNFGGTSGFFGGGGTTFLDNSTAENANIVNKGSTADHGFGPGGTSFAGTSSAANATITNEGGTANSALGGGTGFAGNATADAATLIATNGTNGGQPGQIGFAGDSTGGTSRVELPGGILNIANHNAPGVTIGSLDGNGDGKVFLGGNNLTVGSNNRTTSFAGQIQDGGPFNTATGGSLTKSGTGTLTLSGSNTYTGATTVSAGNLIVDGSIASSSGVTVDAGATLGGHGSVTSIAGAGTISPGNSPGILTATQVNPSGGADFLFEFTQGGSPIYSNAAASGNDVLHLTGATPFTAPLTSANEITIDFSAATLAAGEVFRGGFFTDAATATSEVSNATFIYAGLNGFTVNFDGFVTEPIAEFGTIPGGVPGGRVLEFDIEGAGNGGGGSVPDAGKSILLFGLALAGLFFLRSSMRVAIAEQKRRTNMPNCEKQNRGVVLFGALMLLASIGPAFAGSATWKLSPGSNDWNTASNWTPATVPTFSSDTATFDLSHTTSVSITNVTTNTEVNGIVFTTNAASNQRIPKI